MQRYFPDVSILSEVGQNLSTNEGPKETLKKNMRKCQTRRGLFKKCDDVVRSAISKWQLYNNAKCEHENAVNAVLGSMPVNIHASQEQSENSESNNIVLENEAVLTAIEWKGLKQHNSTYSYYCTVKNPRNNRHIHESHICNSNNNSNDNDAMKYCADSDVLHRHEAEIYNSDKGTTNHEIQEENFEINFIAEAVSTAIEVKGLSLSMHHG